MIKLSEIFGPDIQIFSVKPVLLGITSKNELVFTSDGCFVVRWDERGETQHLLDHTARQIAYDVGVKVPATQRIGPGSVSVCRYIEGSTFKYEQKNTVDVGKILANIHAATPPPFHRESVYHDILNFSSISTVIEAKYGLAEFEFSFQFSQIEWKNLVRILQASSLTHGDLKPDNLIHAENGISILDWEKACSCCKEMDLVLALMFMANSNGFSARWVEDFLSAYFNSAKTNLNVDLLNISLDIVPYVFLMRDAGLAYLHREQRRIDYVNNYAAPTFKNWHRRRIGNLVKELLS